MMAGNMEKNIDLKIINASHIYMKIIFFYSKIIHIFVACSGIFD